MNKKIKWITSAICLFAMPVLMLAQGNKENSKSEQIIIRKKGDSKEKVTIVIDGDKVTVNGKPVDGQTNLDINVIRGKEDLLGESFPRMPSAPSIITIKKNKALLGVYTNENEKGAIINKVSEQSAAEKAGLKEGDIITKVGDKKIIDPEDLTEAIGNLKPEQEVEIAYLRDGKENTVKAKLGKKEEATYTINGDWKGDMDVNVIENFKNFDPPRVYNFNHPESMIEMLSGKKLGLKIQDIEEGTGVKVLDVEEDLPAAKAGIKEGDILTEIDGQKIENAGEALKMIAKSKEKNSFTVKGIRNGTLVNFEIKFPKKLKTVDL